MNVSTQSLHPRPRRTIWSRQTKERATTTQHASSGFPQIQEIRSLVLRESEGVRRWVPDLVLVPTGPVSVIVLEPFLVFPLDPEPLRGFASRSWQNPRRVFLCAHLPGCESGRGRSPSPVPTAASPSPLLRPPASPWQPRYRVFPFAADVPLSLSLFFFPPNGAFAVGLQGLAEPLPPLRSPPRSESPPPAAEFPNSKAASWASRRLRPSPSPQLFLRSDRTLKKKFCHP